MSSILRRTTSTISAPARSPAIPTWGIPVPPGAEGKSSTSGSMRRSAISPPPKSGPKKGAPEALERLLVDPQHQARPVYRQRQHPFPRRLFPRDAMGQKQPYKLVDELPANEFYNLEGKTVLASRKAGTSTSTSFSKFTPDQIRYTIAANAPESRLRVYLERFSARCNTELLGKYGNLVNRALVFTHAHLHGKIPALHADEEFLSRLNALMHQIAEAYDTFHLRKASQLIMELAHAGNAYFDAKKPWKATPEEQQSVLANTLKCIQLLALASFPIIPATAEKVWHLLGYTQPLATKTWNEVLHEPLPAGRALPAPQILFQKVEDEVINMEIAKLEAPKTPTVTIDEFRKVELRIGQILSAERVPKSKRLLKLSVDMGTETRTIVSGIGEKMEDLSFLVGRKVIVVANLPTATLMGVESQGMLLVASSSDGIELPDFKHAKPGDIVS